MNASFKMQGKFLGASPTKQVDGKETKYRNFYIDCTDNPQYPNTPEFSLLNDKCALVDNIKVGEYMAISFNINGKKWEKENTDGTKKKGVSTTLSAWKIELIQYQTPVSVPSSGVAGDDDLPF